jgi:hypothetical protein
LPVVELVYAPDCPNVTRTRDHLRQAFAQAGLASQWLEHDLDDPSTPPHARACGSPTVLVDGHDILDAERCAGSRCRLYRDGEGKLVGVPPVADIVAALLRSDTAHAGR